MALVTVHYRRAFTNQAGQFDMIEVVNTFGSAVCVSVLPVAGLMQTFCASLLVPALGARQTEQGGSTSFHQCQHDQHARKQCSCGACCTSCHLASMGQVMPPPACAPLDSLLYAPLDPALYAPLDPPLYAPLNLLLQCLFGSPFVCLFGSPFVCAFGCPLVCPFESPFVCPDGSPFVCPIVCTLHRSP